MAAIPPTGKKRSLIKFANITPHIASLIIQKYEDFLEELNECAYSIQIGKKLVRVIEVADEECAYLIRLPLDADGVELEIDLSDLDHQDADSENSELLEED